jgi:site-specific DNA recombinase
MTAVLERPADVGVSAPASAGSALGLTLAAKYLRISDDDEGRELGVTRQSDDLDTFGAQNNLFYVETYSDNDIGASTRTRKSKIRKAYLRMLDDAKAGRFQVITAYTSNRLTRRMRENEDLIELAEMYGIRYRYIRSPEHDLNTADGRMMCRWLAAADTGEAERIAERVARAARQRAEKGEFSGGFRPFGFGVQKTVNGLPLVDEDGNPVLDYSKVREDEAALIRDAADVLLAGGYIRAIIRDWNRRGVMTTRGNEWTSRVLVNMLLNPRNAGLSVYGGEILEGVEVPWDPIIDRETWEALRLKLKDPNRRKSPGNKPVHLLTVANCGHVECVGKGHKMRHSMKFDSRKRKDGHKNPPVPMYRCQSRGHNWVNAEALEHLVEGQVIAWLEDPAHAEILVATDTTSKAKELAARSAQLRETLAATKRAFFKGLVTEQDLESAVPEIEQELLTIEAAQADLSGMTPLKGLVGQPDARQRWAALDLGRKKAVINLLMTITITSSPQAGGKLKGGKILDESRVHIEWKV